MSNPTDKIMGLLRSRTAIFVTASTFLLLLLVYLTNHSGLPSFPSQTSPYTTIHAQKIHNSTLGFGRIFVVNMPSRTDHRDAMTLSASLSGLNFTFEDGIDGSTVEPKVLPPEYQRINDAQIGSWRGHLNAIQKVVAWNLSSALICEDDVDWDVRIKGQLEEFAGASRVLSGEAKTEEEAVDSRTSPYGNDWELLWLGHCGVQVPVSSTDYVPPAKSLLPHDASSIHYSHRPGIDYFFSKTHPGDPHLRAVHHAKEAVCTYSYAVSLKGARKILLALGLEKLVQPFDGQLSEWCNHGWENSCLVPSPSYFATHRAKGSDRWDSDINGEKWEQDVSVREKGVSEGIRWSVRLNAEMLLDGAGRRGWDGGMTEGFEDSYPDPT